MQLLVLRPASSLRRLRFQKMGFGTQTIWGPAKLIQLLETNGRKLWPELEKLAAKIQA